MAARGELREVLAAEMSRRTTAEWEARFRAGGVLFHPVYTFSEILGHPQVTESNLIQTVEHTTLGPIPQVGPVIGMHDTPGAITTPPPLLGEHTIEVLREAGYGEAAIGSLLAAAAVTAPDVVPATS